MQHALASNLTSDTNDQPRLKDSSILEFARTPANDDSQAEQLQKDRVVRLRTEGMSYANIMQETGLPERKIKGYCKDVAKGKAVTTPFERSVERALPLAIRPYGIRDYELRDILHREYGVIWDDDKKQFVSNYDSSVVKRVKDRVRTRAELDSRNALFVMDWVNEDAPSASRQYLEACAIELKSQIEACLSQFMESHASQWREDTEAADYAQEKQRYAAENYLLKLAIPGYGQGEPVSKLLKRSEILTETLEERLNIETN